MDGVARILSFPSADIRDIHMQDASSRTSCAQHGYIPNTTQEEIMRGFV
jgi:hypothetical protein